MHKSIRKTINATIINIIVALFFVAMMILFINLFIGAKIDESISLINRISVNKEKKEIIETIITEENEIKTYPEYGTKYATIKIDKIDVDLPVYYGDTMEILKKGVGHSDGSYFPGEGGSIIYMGHNSAKVFRRFSELEKGDEIIVNTSYGEYKYKIYDMQLIKETEKEKLPIQKEKEIFMVYTCYPFNNVGHAYQRYVVYAELEK